MRAGNRVTQGRVSYFNNNPVPAVARNVAKVTRVVNRNDLLIFAILSVGVVYDRAKVDAYNNFWNVRAF